MSDIVLTASGPPEICFSLQDTAALLSTTQTRLATGKEGQQRPRQPYQFLHRPPASMPAASDIGNLLDSIGNGVQVLQAADTGITSLQKLVDTAKSIANQGVAAAHRLQHEVQHPGSPGDGRSEWCWGRDILRTSPPGKPQRRGFSHSRIPRAPPVHDHRR